MHRDRRYSDEFDKVTSGRRACPLVRCKQDDSSPEESPFRPFNALPPNKARSIRVFESLDTFLMDLSLSNSAPDFIRQSRNSSLPIFLRYAQPSAWFISGAAESSQEFLAPRHLIYREF
jgi:hypothetical protein